MLSSAKLDICLYLVFRPQALQFSDFNAGRYHIKASFSFTDLLVSSQLMPKAFM